MAIYASLPCIDRAVSNTEAVNAIAINVRNVIRNAFVEEGNELLDK